MKKVKIKGAKFAAVKMAKPVAGKLKPRTFFRPTTMSVALADAGVIPDVHLVSQLCAFGYFKQKNDTENVRRSAFVPLMVH